MKKIESFFLGVNIFQIAVVNAVCDTGLLSLPDNGKSWNFNAKKKRWELECEVDYEHEKISQRDFHRCRSDGSWASPAKVIVKCRFSSEAVHRELKEVRKLEAKMEKMAKEVSENLKVSLDIKQMMSEPIKDEVDTEPSDPTDKAILVLNTKPFAAKPLVFDLNGNFNDDLDFEYQDLTGAFFGCTAKFGVHMLYFGGVGADAKQMAQLDDCKLTRMPDLNFNFEGGACNTFTETTDDGTQDVVYLCFGDSEAKTCRTYNGTFGEVENDSMFPHSFVELGNYNGSPFVTGSFQTNETNNARTEIFNMTTNSWDYKSSNDYPFGTFIAFYSTVSTDDSVFIIGGRAYPEFTEKEQSQEYTNIIAQFNSTEQWSIFGKLNQQRVGHASILIDNLFYTFGGSVRDDDGNPMPNAFTEIWDITKSDDSQGSRFKKINPYPKSRDYQFGIALIEVDNTDATKKPTYCQKN